jgi:hypothetical protein
MRRSLFALLVAFLTTGQPVPVTAPVPVVVELFTSEGCSSCPPADQVLAALAHDQPVAGAMIIPLGMHVTYWDELGWKDPASLAAATGRQQDYSHVFGADRIYTPQAVIDGHDELVGSDEGAIKRAIAKAAKQPHASVGVTAAGDGASLNLRVRVENVPLDAKEPLEVRVVLTENGLTSIVKRGENGGRTLHHDAVVRQVLDAGLAGSPDVTLQTTVRPEWHRDHMHAVAILQGKKTQRIWGAGLVSLEPLK